MIIIPAILTNDINEFTSLLEKAEKAVDRVQIDVVDGEFANNTTVSPEILNNIATNLSFDFHLMVKDPVNWINKCKPGEKNIIIGQIEKMTNQNEFIDKVKSLKTGVGLGVDLPTTLDKLDENVLAKINLLLLMSVQAGWDHQEFDLSVWDKIRGLVELRKKLNANFKIAIDGGVTKELVTEMANLGVDEVYVGKRIFDPDLKINLNMFQTGSPL